MTFSDMMVLHVFDAMFGLSFDTVASISSNLICTAFTRLLLILFPRKSVEKELDVVKLQHKDLLQQLTTLQPKYKEKEKEAKILVDRKESLELELKSVRSNEDMLLARQDELTQSLSDARDKLKYQLQVQDEHDKDVSRMQVRIDKLEKLLQEHELHWRNAKETLGSLTNELTHLKTEKQAVERQKDEAQFQLQQATQTLQETKISQEKKLDETTKAMRERDAEEERLQQDLQRLQRKVFDMESQIRQAQETQVCILSTLIPFLSVTVLLFDRLVLQEGMRRLCAIELNNVQATGAQETEQLQQALQTLQVTKISQEKQVDELQQGFFVKEEQLRSELRELQSVRADLQFQLERASQEQSVKNDFEEQLRESRLIMDKQEHQLMLQRSNDAQLQEQLEKVQHQNADLHRQVMVLTKELQEWAKRTEEDQGDLPAGGERQLSIQEAEHCSGDDPNANSAIVDVIHFKQHIEHLEAENEALKREVDETDCALRSAEARIVQLENEERSHGQAQDLIRANARLAAQNVVAKECEISQLKREIERLSSKESACSLDGAAGLEVFADSSVGLARKSGKKGSKSFVQLEPCVEAQHEWEDDGSSIADVQRLSSLLKKADQDMNLTERKFQEERERYEARSREQEAAVKRAEQQYSVSAHEATHLAQKLKESMDEVKRLLDENHQLKVRPLQVVRGGDFVDSQSNACARLLDLSASLLHVIRKDPIALEVAPVPKDYQKPRKTQSTVGLVMKANYVEDLVVGGPAFVCQRIHRGDMLLLVNGQPVKPEDSVTKLITGDDLVASCVSLRFQKPTVSLTSFFQNM